MLPPDILLELAYRAKNPLVVLLTPRELRPLMVKDYIDTNGWSDELIDYLITHDLAEEFMVAVDHPTDSTITEAIKHGALNILTQLHRRHRFSHVDPIEQAVKSHQLAVLSFLLAERYAITELAVDHAVMAGDLAALRLLTQTGDIPVSDRAVNQMAIRGDLKIFKHLCRRGQIRSKARVFDLAAKYGHMSMLIYLSRGPNQVACTTDAMDRAAGNGQLDVVQWLHEHRSEGCTTDAMDLAAGNGQLDVVRWLHEHRSEGCTTNAMDRAAANGHLRVVRWLHEHRSEGCTNRAINSAVTRGHLKVVQLLLKHRLGIPSAQAVESAAGRGDLAMVKCLVNDPSVTLTDECLSDAFEVAVAGDHYSVVEWLSERRLTHSGCPVERKQYQVVKWLAQYHDGDIIGTVYHAINIRRYDVVLWLVEHRLSGVPIEVMNYARRLPDHVLLGELQDWTDGLRNWAY